MLNKPEPNCSNFVWLMMGVNNTKQLYTTFHCRLQRVWSLHIDPGMLQLGIPLQIENGPGQSTISNPMQSYAILCNPMQFYYICFPLVYVSLILDSLTSKDTFLGYFNSRFFVESEAYTNQHLTSLCGTLA